MAAGGHDDDDDDEDGEENTDWMNRKSVIKFEDDAEEGEEEKEVSFTEPEHERCSRNSAVKKRNPTTVNDFRGVDLLPVTISENPVIALQRKIVFSENQSIFVLVCSANGRMSLWLLVAINSTWCMHVESLTWEELCVANGKSHRFVQSCNASPHRKYEIPIQSSWVKI